MYNENDSPYFKFAEIQCLVHDMKELLLEDALNSKDFDQLHILIDEMVSGFTDIIIKLSEDDT